ncbi:galactose-binding domain-like protein [Mucidula mucida]|nr:galactose-binding domain-like protein [Mucidula mucida]
MADDNSLAASLNGGDSANIYGIIDKDNVHGLNLTVPEDAKAVIKPWDQRDDTEYYAESGVDDQMIIHVPFTQNVKLKSVLLKLGRGETTPRHLRIYANHPTIVDFSDADNTKPQTGVTEYPLRVAAFTSITSLSLFFSESVGGDSSQLYYLGFKGELRSPQKDANTKLDIPAANAADAALFDRLAEKSGGQQTTAR